jgi:hypothetical protein
MEKEKQILTSNNQESSNQNTEKEEKRTNLINAKEFLTGPNQHLSNVEFYLRESGLTDLSEKMRWLNVRESIDSALDCVNKVPKEAVGSNRDNYYSIENTALETILHVTKPVAQNLKNLNLKDEISMELVRFIALIDELVGGYYMANSHYAYISDEEGIERTKKLHDRYQRGKKNLSYKEDYELFQEKMKFLYENSQDAKNRLFEATNRLDEKTKDLKIDSEQTIAEVLQGIDEELKQL